MLRVSAFAKSKMKGERDKEKNAREKRDEELMCQKEQEGNGSV